MSDACWEHSRATAARDRGWDRGRGAAGLLGMRQQGRCAVESKCQLQQGLPGASDGAGVGLGEARAGWPGTWQFWALALRSHNPDLWSASSWGTRAAGGTADEKGEEQPFVPRAKATLLGTGVGKEEGLKDGAAPQTPLHFLCPCAHSSVTDSPAMVLPRSHIPGQPLSTCCSRSDPGLAPPGSGMQ